MVSLSTMRFPGLIKSNVRSFSVLTSRPSSATVTSASRELFFSTNSSTKTGDNATGTTHFGFENVSIHEKEGRVKEVFNNVAESYDVMNDVMSAGIHRYWKDYFVQQTCVEAIARAVRSSATKADMDGKLSSPSSSAEYRILDVAGGTGDIAFRLLKAAQCEERTKSSGMDPISVTVCDINLEMLRVGERRARGATSGTRIFQNGSLLIDQTKALSFVEGNAQALEKTFADNTFDLYTIAFGLRNVTDVDRALCEAYRVLKPGGRFMCLEFSQVPNPFFRSIYDLYSFNVIPTMGQLVANDRHSYQYLVESIRKFPNQPELVSKMENIAGFQNAKYTNMTGGIVAIHEGWKPPI